MSFLNTEGQDESDKRGGFLFLKVLVVLLGSCKNGEIAAVFLVLFILQMPQIIVFMAKISRSSEVEQEVESALKKLLFHCALLDRVDASE